MKYLPALFPLVLALGGCLSPARYDARFEQKFCDEFAACNPDWECELTEQDHSGCDFDRQAAKDCLEGEWICDNSNTLLPVIGLPEACSNVYTNCTIDTGPTGTETGGGTTSGTPSGTSSGSN